MVWICDLNCERCGSVISTVISTNFFSSGLSLGVAHPGSWTLYTTTIGYSTNHFAANHGAKAAKGGERSKSPVEKAMQRLQNNLEKATVGALVVMRGAEGGGRGGRGGRRTCRCPRLRGARVTVQGHTFLGRVMTMQPPGGPVQGGGRGTQPWHAPAGQRAATGPGPPPPLACLLLCSQVRGWGARGARVRSGHWRSRPRGGPTPPDLTSTPPYQRPHTPRSPQGHGGPLPPPPSPPPPAPPLAHTTWQPLDTT
jgi:hypothetical protein